MSSLQITEKSEDYSIKFICSNDEHRLVDQYWINEIESHEFPKFFMTKIDFRQQTWVKV